ncbi:MAG TPA: SDR family NAD(P)-dependent oxidoreductase [Candidatus Binataceae bacterium]|nr:SDR family NAD(P)-dependent oxidoreductase [Candidatus Binataceae bacterium]
MMLTDRVALITAGAGVGIGRAVATRFLEEGAQVVITDAHPKRTIETAAELTRKFGREVLGIPVDVTQKKQIEEAVVATIKKFGRIDILFNNAGINKLEPIWECKDETWDLVMNVCLRGTFWAMRAVLPHMLKQGKGAIVNMASAAGWIAASDGEAPYCAAKAGVMGLTRAAAGEMAGKGVRVNAIAPSVIYNQFLERIYPPAMFEASKKRNPMGRLGEPREVADLALFLASDMSSYITGEVISISGGSIIVP